MPDRRHHLGEAGETFVANALTRAGYTIVTRNWRHALGEIDLVVRPPDGGRATLVFVEVRTRRGTRAQAAADALASVDARKRARLLALAEAYLDAAGIDGCTWRIDVAAVAWDGRRYTLEVITDAVAW